MSKVRYMVSMGDGSHGDFDSLKEVAIALGVDKVTKKEILAGDYPNITIKGENMRDEVVELTDEQLADLEYKDEFARQEQAQEEAAMLDELEEPKPYQLTQNDMAAIEAIDIRQAKIEDKVDSESVELYDELNRLVIAIRSGVELSDSQHVLLMETLMQKDEVVYDDPADDGKGIETIEELDKALAEVGIEDTDDVEPPAPIDAGHMSIYDDAGNNPALTNIGTGARQTLAGSDVEYPEPGSFKDEKELKKFYKKLSDEQLDEWVELEGLSYKECEHPSINRMRKCMAIRDLHFPKKPKSNTKSKSKYADYSTEQLVDMARKANLPVKDSKGSDQILRMYTIMSLREAGIIV